ncbi:MAG: hypothetical protein ABIO06_11665 [Pseudolysinimonas sp.]
MKETPNTDPRFDPRFQRGYDGPEPGPSATPTMPSPAIDSEAATGGTGGQDDARDSAPSYDEPDAFWTSPRRNPFALALLSGGIAMVAAGSWLVWTMATASDYPSNSDQSSQLFALLQTTLAPALLTAGVLGLVGWLVLGAVAASGRKSE